MSTPRVLPDAVRTLVMAHAAAGATDPHETDVKAIDAARAAARRKLRQERLTHRQAVEVDALVIDTRRQVQKGEIDPTAWQAVQTHAVEARSILAQGPVPPVQVDTRPLDLFAARLERMLFAFLAVVLGPRAAQLFAERAGIRAPNLLASSSTSASDVTVGPVEAHLPDAIPAFAPVRVSHVPLLGAGSSTSTALARRPS